MRVVMAGLVVLSEIAGLSAQEFKTGDAARFHTLVAADAAAELLIDNKKYLEGPCWVPHEGGYLLFSDVPGDEIYRWTRATGVVSWRKPSSEANGNTLDVQGRIVTCEHVNRRITVTRADGTIDVVVDQHDGKKLNSPNDVVVKSDGTVWFTDPPYGLPKGVTKEQIGNFVFRYDPVSRISTAVVPDAVRPNGLCFSPDESQLYVSDTGKPRHIRVFRVMPDGTLADGQVFATIDQGASDGIRCDVAGNLWASAGDGVRVYAPDGTWLGTIVMPTQVSNLCFGGVDGKTLFMTTPTALYLIPTLTMPARRPNR